MSESTMRIMLTISDWVELTDVFQKRISENMSQASVGEEIDTDLIALYGRVCAAAKEVEARKELVWVEEVMVNDRWNKQATLPMTHAEAGRYFRRTWMQEQRLGKVQGIRLLLDNYVKFIEVWGQE